MSSDFSVTWLSIDFIGSNKMYIMVNLEAIYALLMIVEDQLVAKSYFSDMQWNWNVEFIG